MANEKFKHAVERVGCVRTMCGAASDGLEESPTIKVCVRVRPFIKEEIEGDRCGGRVECCIAMPTVTTVEMVGREDPRRFEFDRCYWSHSSDHPLYANQQTLQDELGQSMLMSAMNGFNNCIFAYGQTGSGKSFSVLGGKGEHRGLLPRVVEGLFEHFAQLDESVQTKTEVSFLEIYNEQIRDLFAVKEDGQKELPKLEVKQHAVLGTIIPGLTEAPVKSCEDVMKLVDYGTQMRVVSETAMNATSSRSHCIFTFKTSVSESEGQAKMSCTHLVDLAGSERAGRTKATGQRLKEGAAINQSLSVLATVIRELAKQTAKKKTNPPFRGSKLTYILKESLCGNSKTVMMAAISPALADYDETLSTLNFAKSVKQVQTKAVVNQVNEKGVEEALRAELEELRLKLASMERQQSQRRLSGQPPDPVVIKESAGRMSIIERRLKEQEQICRYFGKDWEEIVAEESKKQQKRAALLLDDSKILAFRGAHVDASDSARSDGDPAATTVDETGEDGEQSDSEDSVTDTERRLQVPLIHLQRWDNEEGRTTLRLGIPSSIAVVGPRAASCRVSEREVEDRSHHLRDLRAGAARAEEAVSRLSAKTAPQLRLRVVVAVDPGEAGEGMAVESLVQASRMATRREEEDQAPGSDDVDKEEWMSEESLLKRLNWLEAALQEGSFDQSTYDGDAWRAATAAANGEPLSGAPAEPAQPAEPLPAPESPEIAAGRSAAREVNRLNGELAIAQEELSRLKSKLKQEKVAAKDLREELLGTQDELAKAKAKMKAMSLSYDSPRAPRLKEEPQTPKEEVARRDRAEPEANLQALSSQRTHADDLSQGQLQAAQAAKVLALTLDSAIRAVDVAHAELTRIGSH